MFLVKDSYFTTERLLDLFIKLAWFPNPAVPLPSQFSIPANALVGEAYNNRGAREGTLLCYFKPSIMTSSCFPPIQKLLLEAGDTLVKPRSHCWGHSHCQNWHKHPLFGKFATSHCVRTSSIYASTTLTAFYSALLSLPAPAGWSTHTLLLHYTVYTLSGGAALHKCFDFLFHTCIFGPKMLRNAIKNS